MNSIRGRNSNLPTESSRFESRKIQKSNSIGGKNGSANLFNVLGSQGHRAHDDVVGDGVTHLQGLQTGFEVLLENGHHFAIFAGDVTCACGFVVFFYSS
jgi:hypothetical protein